MTRASLRARARALVRVPDDHLTTRIVQRVAHLYDGSRDVGEVEDGRVGVEARRVELV